MCQASELLVLNFGLLITNNSHFWRENLQENMNVSVGLSTFTHMERLTCSVSNFWRVENVIEKALILFSR